MNMKTQLTSGLIFWGILLVTFILYWPGLNGILLLDDEPNLSTLAQISSFSDIGRFITEGITSQLGRPLSLLSFALQFHSWPTANWDFKYINLLIHLLNGGLVFWLLLLLTRSLNNLTPLHQLFLALFTTAVWLLHPLQVSTVLYTVQRMTQLSAMFTLLGLITYLQGRYALVQQQPRRGFILMSLGIGIGGVLATLSKENGILLILYVLVLETTLLPSLPKPRHWHLWAIPFIYAPLTLLILYFAVNFGQFLQAYAIRDFTMGERLLTETRVLVDYLAKILLLKQNFGLFFDDYIPSRHLLMPPITVLTVSLIIGSLLSAWRLRRRFPLFAFALLWFAAGHLLESSFISLVLYFEHRNYLPMLGILFGLSYGLFTGYHYLSSSRLQTLATTVMGGGLLWLLLFLTWSQTTLWGQPILQAHWWAEQKPQSRFAQSHAAEVFERLRDYPTVEHYYRQMVTTFPSDTGPYTLWLSLACRHPQQVTAPEWPAVMARFQTGQLDTATISGLAGILQATQQGQCQLTPESLEQIFQTLIHNPHTTIYLQHLYRLYAFFQARQQHYLEAVTAAKHSLRLNSQQPQLQLTQIEWLMVAQQREEAKKYLQTIHQDWNPVILRLYEKQLERLEQWLKSE